MKYEHKDGEYYYFPCGNFYAVYLWHKSNDGHGSGDKIEDHLTKDQAKSRVYELNGWNKK